MGTMKGKLWRQGYYWIIGDQDIFDRKMPSVVRDFRSLLERKVLPAIAGPDGKGEPIIREGLHFNGSGDEAGDAFRLMYNQSSFGYGFCRTDEKAYGLAVAVALLLAKYHFGRWLIIYFVGSIDPWLKASEIIRTYLGYEITLRSVILEKDRVPALTGQAFKVDLVRWRFLTLFKMIEEGDLSVPIKISLLHITFSMLLNLEILEVSLRILEDREFSMGAEASDLVLYYLKAHILILSDGLVDHNLEGSGVASIIESYIEAVKSIYSRLKSRNGGEDKRDVVFIGNLLKILDDFAEQQSFNISISNRIQPIAPPTLSQWLSTFSLFFVPFFLISYYMAHYASADSLLYYLVAVIGIPMYYTLSTYFRHQQRFSSRDAAIAGILFAVATLYGILTAVTRLDWWPFRP